MIALPLRVGLAVLALLALAGCSPQPELAREGSYDRADSLFDPAAAIRQGWVERALTPDAGERRTGYSIDSYQDRPSIRAEGQHPASALVLPVHFDAADCPETERHE